MMRFPSGVVVVLFLGVVWLATFPGQVDAQYRCAVAIELKGKAVLQGEIRDTERPSTKQLWDLLKTLSFSATKDGKDLPDPKSVETATLKGELRVKINGAGQVELKEITLVRNKLSTEAW